MSGAIRELRGES
jgi:hypothetical protein